MDLLLVVQPSAVNTIDYITIASTGDAIDFGDFRQLSRNFKEQFQTVPPEVYLVQVMHIF